MDGPRRSGPAPGDPAGERGAWRPAFGYLALAAALVVLGAFLWLVAPSPPTQVADATPPASLPATSPVAVAARPAAIAASAEAPPPMPGPAAAGRPALVPASGVSRTRDANGDQTPDIADYVNSGENPSMAEVIDRLHQAGVHSGLGAFSPPGTRPPLVGLAVPEDFVLPDGYVRHYQATDDGRRLEPILMFAPDRRFVDAANQPISIPQDRVVPPEQAPPGMPIRRIVIPAPAEPGK